MNRSFTGAGFVKIEAPFSTIQSDVTGPISFLSAMTWILCNREPLTPNTNIYMSSQSDISLYLYCEPIPIGARDTVTTEDSTEHIVETVNEDGTVKLVGVDAPVALSSLTKTHSDPNDYHWKIDSTIEESDPTLYNSSKTKYKVSGMQDSASSVNGTGWELKSVNGKYYLESGVWKIEQVPDKLVYRLHKTSDDDYYETIEKYEANELDGKQHYVSYLHFHKFIKVQNVYRRTGDSFVAKIMRNSPIFSRDGNSNTLPTEFDHSGTVVNFEKILVNTIFSNVSVKDNVTIELEEDDKFNVIGDGNVILSSPTIQQARLSQQLTTVISGHVTAQPESINGNRVVTNLFEFPSFKLPHLLIDLEDPNLQQSLQIPNPYQYLFNTEYTRFKVMTTPRDRLTIGNGVLKNEWSVPVDLSLDTLIVGDVVTNRFLTNTILPETLSQHEEVVLKEQLHVTKWPRSGEGVINFAGYYTKISDDEWRHDEDRNKKIVRSVVSDQYLWEFVPPSSITVGDHVTTGTQQHRVEAVNEDGTVKLEGVEAAVAQSSLTKIYWRPNEIVEVEKTDGSFATMSVNQVNDDGTYNLKVTTDQGEEQEHLNVSQSSIRRKLYRGSEEINPWETIEVLLMNEESVKTALSLTGVVSHASFRSAVQNSLHNISSLMTIYLNSQLPEADRYTEPITLVDDATPTLKNWASQNTVTEDTSLQAVRNILGDENVAMGDAATSLEQWFNEGNIVGQDQLEDAQTITGSNSLTANNLDEAQDHISDKDQNFPWQFEVAFGILSGSATDSSKVYKPVDSTDEGKTHKQFVSWFGQEDAVPDYRVSVPNYLFAKRDDEDLLSHGYKLVTKFYTPKETITSVNYDGLETMEYDTSTKQFKTPLDERGDPINNVDYQMITFAQAKAGLEDGTIKMLPNTHRGRDDYVVTKDEFINYTGRFNPCFNFRSSAAETVAAGSRELKLNFTEWLLEVGMYVDVDTHGTFRTNKRSHRAKIVDIKFERYQIITVEQDLPEIKRNTDLYFDVGSQERWVITRRAISRNQLYYSRYDQDVQDVLLYEYDPDDRPRLGDRYTVYIYAISATKSLESPFSIIHGNFKLGTSDLQVQNVSLDIAGRSSAGRGLMLMHPDNSLYEGNALVMPIKGWINQGTLADLHGAEYDQTSLFPASNETWQWKVHRLKPYVHLHNPTTEVFVVAPALRIVDSIDDRFMGHYVRVDLTEYYNPATGSKLKWVTNYSDTLFADWDGNGTSEEVEEFESNWGLYVKKENGFFDTSPTLKKPNDQMDHGTQNLGKWSDVAIHASRGYQGARPL